METFQQTLAEQMGIDLPELADRMEKFGFGQKDIDELTVFAPAAREVSQRVVDDFYRRQMMIPQIRRVIGDVDTLARLVDTMRAYVERSFSGDYGLDYANSRLRIGRVHARMGVPPRDYITSLYALKRIVDDYLMSSGLIERPPTALEKLMMMDLLFVFDAYVHELIEQADAARNRPMLRSRERMALAAGHHGAPPVFEPMLDEAMRLAMGEHAAASDKGAA